MLEVGLSVLALVIAGWAIVKNYDAKMVLFLTGLALLIVAVILGHPVLPEKSTSGLDWVDPFKTVQMIFINQYSKAGLIIMALFGFAGYMSHIGANDRVIYVLSKPLAHVKNPYLLVPLVYILGNLLSVIIPSAASLSVILMATLYPVLRAARMSQLTAAGVIATTATLFPTPLGGDNVLAARILGFDHVVDYVFYHHAPITLPSLAVMTVVHFFWQRYMDKRSNMVESELDTSKFASLRTDIPVWYAIFPVLPLILVIFFWVFFRSVKVGLVEITVFCFVIVFLTERIRKRDWKVGMKDAAHFFNGFGDGFNKVVVLMVAASTTVAGLSAMGLIDAISKSISEVQNAGLGLMFGFSGITTLVTIVTGSGNAAFYSFVEIIPKIAEQAGIDPIMATLPMQCMSNLFRAASPVSAVVIIVSGVINVSPIEILKRTWVPLFSGGIAVLVFAMLRYL